MSRIVIVALVLGVGFAAAGVPAAAGEPTAAKLVTITDKAITLRDPIFFETGKPNIKQESFAELDALAAALAADKKITLVEIGVHTDERGSLEFNARISQDRADAILKYLIDHKVDPKRLRAKGYGESKPLDKAHNEQAWAKNRRTEFTVLQRTS